MIVEIIGPISEDAKIIAKYSMNQRVYIEYQDNIPICRYMIKNNNIICQPKIDIQYVYHLSELRKHYQLRELTEEEIQEIKVELL